MENDSLNEDLVPTNGITPMASEPRLSWKESPQIIWKVTPITELACPYYYPSLPGDQPGRYDQPGGAGQRADLCCQAWQDAGLECRGHAMDTASGWVQCPPFLQSTKSKTMLSIRKVCRLTRDPPDESPSFNHQNQTILSGRFANLQRAKLHRAKWLKHYRT